MRSQKNLSLQCFTTMSTYVAPFHPF